MLSTTFTTYMYVWFSNPAEKNCVASKKAVVKSNQSFIRWQVSHDQQSSEVDLHHYFKHAE